MTCPRFGLSTSILLALAVLAVAPSLLSGARASSDVAVAWTTTEAAYNPSLVEHGDKFISALKRTTFLKAKAKIFWVNHLYMCVGLHDNVQGLRCQTYNPWREPYLECEFDSNVRDGRTDVTGLGDVKVWTWPGKGVYTIFGRKPQRVPGAGPYCTSKVVYDQWIAQVRSEQTAGQWRLQQPLRLHLTDSFKYPDTPSYVMEKNWMPWVSRHTNGTESLMMTHTVNPHRVLKVSTSGACEVVHETVGKPELFAPFEGHSIHGGPPVVWVDAKLSMTGLPYYMGIMHHVEMLSDDDQGAARGGRKKKPKKKKKLYRHFAYKFEPAPPFAITDISDEINLTFFRHPNYPTKAHIAYVAGLHLSSNGTVFISYGAGDREARIMTTSMAEMESLFTGKIAFLQTGSRHT